RARPHPDAEGTRGLRRLAPGRGDGADRLRPELGPVPHADGGAAGGPAGLPGPHPRPPRPRAPAHRLPPGFRGRPVSAGAPPSGVCPRAGAALRAALSTQYAVRSLCYSVLGTPYWV